MNRPRRTIAIVVVAIAVVSIAATAAVALAGMRSQPGVGSGMMGSGSGSYGPGMMGGSFGGVGAGGAGTSGTATPTEAQLAAVNSRVDSWLAANGFTGFKVAEVMAFSNNDYVAVHDSNGMPAFELLTDLATNWIMEEPPSMMWNTRYGMMGGLGNRVSPMMGGWNTSHGWNGWYGAGSGNVPTTVKAVGVANHWLATASPGERVATDAGGSAMGKFPGYYSFDTTRDGKTAGMLSVNARTGAVWYHAWHGTFLAEQEF